MGRDYIPLGNRRVVCPTIFLITLGASFLTSFCAFYFKCNIFEGNVITLNVTSLTSNVATNCIKQISSNSSGLFSYLSNQFSFQIFVSSSPDLCKEVAKRFYSLLPCTSPHFLKGNTFTNLPFSCLGTPSLELTFDTR